MSSVYRNLLIVIKQTAFEEYSQLKLRGLAPKALRWKRLESRYNQHKSCVTRLIECLHTEHPNVNFSCVNRADLDRQHLHGVDLVLAVGGDGTVLSAAHFLDNGTIPLAGINSDPSKAEDKQITKKTDERRSHGALCSFTSDNLDTGLRSVLTGKATISRRARIQVTVKSTFSETRLVPALNDVLIAHPTPASVSRFRMGWLAPLRDSAPVKDGTGGAGSIPHQGVVRVAGETYEVKRSFNAWSSGMWIATPTGSTAAMHAAGGKIMNINSPQLQYLIREHLIESHDDGTVADRGHGMLNSGAQLHLRWNSNEGKIFVDGAHLSHDLQLGDEIVINDRAPELQLFMPEEEDRKRGQIGGSLLT